MPTVSTQQLSADVDLACRRTSGAVAVERAVAAQLQRAVGFDAWCALTIDPASVLPTGGYHEEGVPEQYLPQLVEIEARGEDALAFPALAREASRVSVLSRATDGKPERSQRYREVLAPAGLGHELRISFTTRTGMWGVLVLFRASTAPDFSPGEVELVDGTTTGVAVALRRELVLTEIAHGEDLHGPGLLLLDSSTLTVGNVTTAAGKWLEEIEDGVDATRGLPYSVVTVAHRALSGAGPARARLRTRQGRWLTLHAEQLDDPSQVSVIVEPTRPVEIAELVADAYGLTDRERQVVRLLAAGYSRKEIAGLLIISQHTVDDHVKRVFAKLDVASRAELTAKLFFDQHLPRMAAEVPVGGTGWFLR